MSQLVVIRQLTEAAVQLKHFPFQHSSSGSCMSLSLTSITLSYSPLGGREEGGREGGRGRGREGGREGVRERKRG